MDVVTGPLGAATSVLADPRQVAAAVLMVRPASFGWNEQTHGSNRFQREELALAADASTLARGEFDRLAQGLAGAGVEVCVAEDRAEPVCPDAVFPNNWVSFHADGTVVLYPMLARNRRLERRLDLVSELAERRRFRVTRLLDLTHHEHAGRYLEGTGSVVFDHVGRVAYACLSPRTHPAPLEELCGEFGYEPCAFEAADAQGVAIYHTNVMLAIGSRWCAVGSEAIATGDRERVTGRLAASGREIVPLSQAQLARFAGNVLELRAQDGAGVLALSSAAASAIGDQALAGMQSMTGRIVVAHVPTIETLGGGSVRCTLAEIFLPR
jgi:hypothetical protein